MEIDTILLGDCLEVMKDIPDKSIDAIICDLPYEKTDEEWDKIIRFDKLWEQYKRIVKKHSPIVLFSSEPFTSFLILSKVKWFKYRLNWDKVIPSGMGYAKYRPMEKIEDICIFSKNGSKTVYNPQMIKRDKPIKSGGNSIKAGVYKKGFKCINGDKYDKTYNYKNPTTLISFNKIRKGAIHPTQKPVALLEYLIKTYSNEGDLILDNCSGSGTTAIACKNLNRHFICIEKEPEYWKKSVERLKENE